MQGNLVTVADVWPELRVGDVLLDQERRAGYEVVYLGVGVDDPSLAEVGLVPTRVARVDRVVWSVGEGLV